ncbi:MAG: hypothetical protein GC185_11150 [Alphaproteobacteria bacterium]|nr:hypothetical protein [Alphaproteobacteria bacterium]
MRQPSFWSGLLASCGIIVSLATLSACDMTTPSQVKTGEIRVMDSMKTVRVDAQAVDEQQVAVIADDYRATGKSRVMLLLPYLEGNPVNRVAARHRGEMYKKALMKRGVGEVEVSYLAVKDPQKAQTGVLSYMAETAEGPKDCTPLVGYNGGDTRTAMEKYGIGCEMKTAISRMVVQPSDLMGKGGTPQDESRREGAVVEKYKAGTQNTPLQGTLSASTVGSGG